MTRERRQLEERLAELDSQIRTARAENRPWKELAREQRKVNRELAVVIEEDRAAKGEAAPESVTVGLKPVEIRGRIRRAKAELPDARNMEILGLRIRLTILDRVIREARAAGDARYRRLIPQQRELNARLVGLLRRDARDESKEAGNGRG